MAMLNEVWLLLKELIVVMSILTQFQKLGKKSIPRVPASNPQPHDLITLF